MSTGYSHKSPGKPLIQATVIGGGVVLTLLVLMILVEVLAFAPLRSVVEVRDAFWEGRAAGSGFEAVVNYSLYYLDVMVNVWLLLLVPILGFVVTSVTLRWMADDARLAFVERLQEQDKLLTDMRKSEAQALGRWERTETGFDAMTQDEPSAWLVVDGQQRIRRFNQGALQFLKRLGNTSDDLEGRNMADVWPGWVNTALYRLMTDPMKTPVMNGEVELANGPVTRVHAWVWPLGDDTAMLLQDVSYMYQPEAVKENAEALARQLVEDSVRPVAVLDLQGRYMYVSRKWHETLGIAPGTPLNGKTHAEMAPNFPANFNYALQQLEQGQLVGKEDERRVVNGQEERLSWHIRPWSDATGRPAGYIFTVINNTELMRLRAQVKDAGEREHALAYSDMLTGLPNRQLFNDRLNMALAQAYRQLGKVGLLFLDLDGFKAVNDKLGHEYGDLLLKQVAERLKGCIRQTDTVARLGGDEFTMILSIRDRNDAEEVAKKILETISRPYNLAGTEAHVGTSIGIALYPQDGTQAADLIRMADNAMYAAKQAGKNTWRFHVAEQKTG